MNPYDFTIKTVREAGKLLLEKREEGFFVMQKNQDPRDIVTSVDNDVNDFIVNAIKKEFPSHGIHSEESKDLKQESEYLWTIDPIDGTANFSRNIPHFAICLGLLKDGIPISGAVYNPVTKELFSFEKGKGAFLNNKQIHVSKIDNLIQAHVFFRAGRKQELREWGGKSYKALIGATKKTSSLGSSSLDTCFVAAGRIEASIYGTLSTLDITSAIGILLEVGGVVADENGKLLSFSDKPKKTFMANNDFILNSLTKLLEEN